VPRQSCDKSAKDILNCFFFPLEVIGHSLGEFDGNWDNLEGLVDQWWKAYKEWERQDTLVAAYQEQRLTVKGTSEMGTKAEMGDSKGDTIEARVQAHVQQVGKPADYDPKAQWPRYNVPGAPEVEWPSEVTKFKYPINKTNISIRGRLKPDVFKPDVGVSQKTNLGYHDLSALLLNPNAPISKQQYKGFNPGQVYVFMPLSFAVDQAVFQNINMLAKLCRAERPDFYKKVTDIRSKMTRIKLIAEHDMATNFIMVGKSYSTGLPKFKYTLTAKTDISVRDEAAGLVPEGTFQSTLTELKIEDALNPKFKSNQRDYPTLAEDYPDLKPTPRSKLLVWLKGELKPVTGPPALTLRADELERKVKSLLNAQKARGKLPAVMKPSAVPTDDNLAFYIELILNRAGGKTKQTYTTTAAIFQARQSAALSFQTLVLGEIMRYAEVTIAYRHHAGDFPKFAQWDGKQWIVGTVNAQNVWTAKNPTETFPDKPA
jgi:hypothetical protein